MDEREQRIRATAYRIWQEEGCPEGRAQEHWNMAAALIAIEENHELARKPTNQNRAAAEEPVEPLEALQNVNDVPAPTDPGAGSSSNPRPRKKAASPKGRRDDPSAPRRPL
jgi:hypothetical protein